MNDSPGNGIGGQGGASPLASPIVAPGQYPITLGDVTFSSEECPDIFPVGASDQMIVVHNMPGGSVVTNDFGNKPSDIEWTGRFYSQNIIPRVLQLRLYKMAGEEILLSGMGGVEQYHVKIKEFDPGWRGGYNEYRIKLVVTRDANGAFAVPTSPTVDSQVSALMAQAISSNENVQAVDPIGSVPYQTYLQQLQSLLLQYAPLAQNLLEGLGPIGEVAGSLLTALTAYAGSLSPTSPQFADLSLLIGSVQGIANAVLGGTSSRSVSTFGGELFSVAATQYGDVTQCFNLAKANGYVYPLLGSGFTQPLDLPELPPVAFS
jgi:hypothetical protein